MIAVIKGDIVSSRKIADPEKWLLPLKALFNEWGASPGQWELVWGVTFQLEIERPEEALKRALQVKALIKKIGSGETNKGPIDVRMAIGIGRKSYSAERITESNGEAFINAGERFEELEKEKSRLQIKSPWSEFDVEMNLLIRLASVFMDKWSVASAELVGIVLKNPGFTQLEVGKQLGIRQNSVSGRWKRANIDEVLALEQIYRRKLGRLL